MTFTGMSLLGVGLGIAALAGALILLQRLRVRHHPLTVETTLFWNDAIEEARARVLVKRFRHPWAYVLVLAIASCLWIAFATPELAADKDRRHLFLLDGSAAMAGRIDEAVELLTEELRALPSSSRTVVLCGDVPRTILLPGENEVLLEARCEDFVPVRGRVDLEGLVQTFLAADAASGLTVTLVGDAVLDADFVKTLPDTVSVRRLMPLGTSMGTRVVAFGQGPAESGSANRVDVLVTLRTSDGKAPTLRATVDGRAVEAAKGSRIADDTWEFRWRDLPAEGGRFAVAAISSDGRQNGAKDVSLSLVLSDLRPLPVAMEPGLPKVLMRVFEADPQVAVADPSSAVLVVRWQGSGFGGDAPAFELGAAAGAEDAFYFEEPGEGVDAARLRDLVEDLGLDTVDGPGLAERLRSTVTIGASPGPRRVVRVWRELLGEDAGFTATAAFPVFVARSLRWLAARREEPRRVAVGEPLIDVSGPVTTPSGHDRDPVGDLFTPRWPGVHADAAGRSFEASVLEPISAGGPADLPTSTGNRGGSWDAVSVVLLLALGMLAVEWILLRRGSMP